MICARNCQSLRQSYGWRQQQVLLWCCKHVGISFCASQPCQRYPRKRAKAAPTPTKNGPGLTRAPALSSSLTLCALPRTAARWSGVRSFCAAAFTSACGSRARGRRSSRTAPMWPSPAAAASGVLPAKLRALRFAPAASSILTTATWPSREAAISGVVPAGGGAQPRHPTRSARVARSERAVRSAGAAVVFGVIKRGTSLEQDLNDLVLPQGAPTR